MPASDTVDVTVRIAQSTPLHSIVLTGLYDAESLSLMNLIRDCDSASSGDRHVGGLQVDSTISRSSRSHFTVRLTEQRDVT
jgi:hypothetical protein